MTTNNHGLEVEGRGGDALSIRLDAKADRLNDEEDTGRNGRAGEKDEERVNSFTCDNQPPRPSEENGSSSGSDLFNIITSIATNYKIPYNVISYFFS